MRKTALILICALIWPLNVIAQQPPTTAPGWSVLESTLAGRNVQVELNSGKSIKGKLEAITDSALELSAKGARSTCRYGDIRRIYVLRGRPAARNTLIGAAVGGGAGAAFGAVVGRNDDWFGPGLFAAVFAGIGAVIGSVVGFFMGVRQHKDLVYDAAPARR
jgi:hypothetical protein